ncbi:hypothetical protein [Alkalihalophilus marmarensis]|uniref:Uncharacterized protein n=1 Tax=Alkalihalophilus marmarensis DSM 21297 TaxID=1188261 RepID=U6SL12_9BACI|nr:hypothetical protein [Alkalihalophilus marmarensis]ERN52077.1 hypothetical protein A33I_18465 [Alkalihalophilus marmarensis DSM 21297]
MVDQIFVHLKKDHIKLAEGSEKKVEAFTEEEVQKLLTHVNGKARLRNKVIVYLAKLLVNRDVNT